MEAPIKSSRIFAIEKILRFGGSSRVLKALEKRLRQEDDEECQILIGHALDFLRNGSPGKTSAAKLDPGAVLPSFRTFSIREKISWLCGLSTSQLKPLASRAPSLLEQEGDTPVTPFLLRAFMNVWPVEANELLRSRLLSKRLSIRLAALEGLAVRVPKLLEELLPDLLIADDPRTRILAIRSLVDHDPDEAIAHLNFILSSQDEAERRLGLQCCVHLPFERVMPLLLQFLIRESNLDLVRGAGLHFRINPVIEAPFFLAEIAASQVDPERSSCFNSLFEESLQALSEAKLLIQPIDEVRKRAQEWGAEQHLRKLIKRLLEQEDAYGLRFFQIQVLAREDRFASVADKILREFSVPGVVEEPPAPPPPPEKPLKQLSPEEILRLIASLKESDKPYAHSVLSELITAPDTPPNLCSAALRRAAAFGIRDFVEVCEKFLRSSSPLVKAAALEYLGVTVPENILPHIGKFLGDKESRLRNIAVKILVDNDPTQALSFISSFLGSDKVEHQSLALGWLIHFHFDQIRDVLLEYLSRPPQPIFFERALHFFVSNPTTNHVYDLFRLSDLLPQKQVELRSATDLLEKAMLDCGMIDSEHLATLRRTFPHRLEQAKIAKKKATPAYAAHLIHTRASLHIPLQDLKGVWNYVSGGVVAVLIVITFIWWSLNPPSSSSREFFEKDATGAIAPIPITVNGTYERANTAGDIRLTTQDHKTYHILRDSRFPDNALCGASTTFLILPFRRCADGLILARFLAP